MARGEDLRTTADALDGSIVVCGLGDAADADGLSTGSFPGARVVSVPDLIDGRTGSGTTPTESGDSTEVVAAVVVVGPSTDEDTLADLREVADTGVFTVAVVSGDDADADALATITAAVDGVLLAGDGAGSALGPASTVREFLAAVQDPGFVNLDLTDARTVLASGLAAVATGSAPRDAPAVAVESAFDRLPCGVDAATASAVLVDVVVDPDTSITAATDAIGEVRARIGADANVIWGGAVDDDAADALLVRVVVADVRYDPPLAAGDPCPRCGSSLSAYTFGASETLSCDACGYSGIGMRRR
ncbi:hypothetical protein J2751_001917 [Halorubrum alkaliphilum]|uniref:Tubulin/FtsZ 2-layer sandwich domain-containing protein n=1 Tax=Halorubrum alkaliphilum TaxID=261290 RepID=A0A8T4GHL2_9EURY|nr:hypothetical protein [Halorubrum alkaliphilum]MBP1922901.1 hypothetical protein [Halorubrum alkaliphilum]